MQAVEVIDDLHVKVLQYLYDGVAFQIFAKIAR
jgi:hypothetical protein